MTGRDGRDRGWDPDFDGNRLSLHPEEVAYWLREGRTRGPLYTEFEITTNCPQHCTFCGVDHIVNREGIAMETDLALRILRQLHALGNKSVLVSGHGEPLAHPDAASIIARSSELMSTALTTNGALLHKHDIGLVDGLKWLRFSVNGYDPQNYSAVHGVPEEVFGVVLENMASVVARKHDLGLECVIGTQLVLLDQNAEGVPGLAAEMKRIGVDYFSVKPYSQHPLSTPRRRPDYRNVAHLEKELKALADESFTVSFRSAAMARTGRPKDYDRCHGTHFMTYVSADAGLWECNVFAGDARFYDGDLSHESLADLWAGERRRRVLRFIERDLSLSECRDLCRLDACNRYLWRLANPLAHDDFI